MFRLFTVKATKTLPALVITKSFKLYAYLDENTNGKTMTICNLELLGFNMGDFSMKPTDALGAALNQIVGSLSLTPSCARIVD